MSIEKKPVGRPQKNEAGGVRINVQVTPEEHQKLKIFCAVNKTTITEIVKKMIVTLPD